jgi:hypothetical protein
VAGVDKAYSDTGGCKWLSGDSSHSPDAPEDQDDGWNKKRREEGRRVVV